MIKFERFRAYDDEEVAAHLNGLGGTIISVWPMGEYEYRVVYEA